MHIDEEVRTSKNLFNNLPFSPKSSFAFIAQFPRSSSFTFYVIFGILHTQNKDIEVRSNAKTTKIMHIKRCMTHKYMTIKHLMHKGSYKDIKRIRSRTKRA